MSAIFLFSFATAFSRALLAGKVHPSPAEREAWVHHGRVPLGFIARP